MIRKLFAVAITAVALVAPFSGAASAADGSSVKIKGSSRAVANQGKTADASAALGTGISTQSGICTRSGGSAGYGYLTGSVRQQEYGTGTDQFRQVGQVQYQLNGVWYNDGGTGSVTSNVFPDDGASYAWTINWRADFGSNSAGRPVRLWIRAEYLKFGAVAAVANAYLGC